MGGMMKTRRIGCGWAATWTVVCCLAGSSFAVGFVNDNFESYTVGTSLTGLVARGWGASDPGVVVTNNVFNNPTNMAVLPPTVVASNNIGGGTGKIWTDCLLDETVRLDPSTLPPMNPAVSVMVGVTTDGFAAVYNPASNGWDICASDARGSNLTGVASGSWVRVSLCQDYAAHVSALFLNGRLVRQQIPFITNLTSYGTFRLRSGAGSSAYLDNVFVSNAIPSDLSSEAVSYSSDVDGDGVPDVWEIQNYNDLSTWGPVVSNSIVFNCPNVTLNNLTVTNGAVLSLSASGLTITGAVQVAGASAILITNEVVVISNLVISSNASVRVVNGMLVANGLTLSGTFTLDSGWSGVLTPSSLNFTDDFETYPLGLTLDRCGGWGWGASSPGSVVQSNVVVHGVQSALVSPVSSLSNVVSMSAAVLSNVWTDVNICDTAPRYAGMDYPTVNTNRAVMLFVNTNNHVVIWNSNGWDECSLDVVGNAAEMIATGQWARITLFEDFGAKKVALFVNGHLLRQQIPFISSAVGSYGLLNLNAGSGAAYLDNVMISTNLPDSLTNGPNSDIDHDGIADAMAIQLYGRLLFLPRGSMFKIR